MSTREQESTKEIFGEIFARTAPGLLSAARRVLGDSHAAEDVVQEAYVNLYRAMQAEQLVQSPEAWLRTAVINGALNRREREGIRTWQPLWNDLVNGKATPVEAILAATDEQKRIDGIIDKLPEQQRKTFIMHAVIGMSFSEVGQALGCRADTAQDYFRAARIKLFHVFRPYLEEE